MIVMICVDDNGGTMFNHRRQSQDRVLREHILELANGRPVWVSEYTARQFAPEDQLQLRLADDPLLAAGEGEFCLVEGSPVLPHEERIESVILFRWNRVYPADTYLDIPLIEHGWSMAEAVEITGYSHKKITQEIYRR